MQQDHHINSTDRALGNWWPQSCTEILLCPLTISAGPVIGIKEVAAAQGEEAAVGSKSCLPGLCQSPTREV